MAITANAPTEINKIAGFKYSFFWKIILLVPLLFCFLIAGLAVYLPASSKQAAIESAVRDAIDRSSQLKSMRTFYTEFVAKRAAASNNLTPSAVYADHPDKIPAPTTFLLDYTDQLQANEKIRVYSAYPWSYRKDRKLDAFQQNAWTTLTANPDMTVQEFVTENGREYVRVATADRMGESCVACHNTNPNSPKTGWKVGDVRGVIEIKSDVTEMMQTAREQAWSTIIGIAVFAVIALLIIMKISRTVAVPLQSLADRIRDVLAGNIGGTIDHQTRNDEVGVVARAVNEMQHVLNQRRSLQEENAAKSAQIDASLTKLREMSRVFDTRVAGLVSELSRGAEQMRRSCGDTADLARR